jgi:hypothetical protein
MSGDSFSISEKYLRFHFHNKTEDREIRNSKKWDAPWHHYGLFHQVANFICEECHFEISDTPYPETVTKNYPSLWKDHRWGGNKHLRFEGKRYPAGFEFVFWYQDSRTGNSHGGKYDIDTGNHATKLEKLVFRNVARKVTKYLTSLGYEEEINPDLNGRAFVMHDINDRKRRHWGAWESYKDDPYHKKQNARDRDGKVIENGQVKYFRDGSGRLSYGEVYHNINNMWWVVVNEYEFENKACFVLFDPTPEDFAARRVIRDRAKPDEKVRRKIGTRRYNELRALGVKMTLEETK